MQPCRPLRGQLQSSFPRNFYTSLRRYGRNSVHVEPRAASANLWRVDAAESDDAGRLHDFPPNRKRKIHALPRPDFEAMALVPFRFTAIQADIDAGIFKPFLQPLRNPH